MTELLVANARIWTGDESRPWATTALIQDGRFAFVGEAVELTAPSSATVLDAEGRLVVPGLTDGHVHLDPAYGEFQNLGDRSVPRGAVVELLCPGCGVSLEDPEAVCSICSTSMFVLQLPRGGFVEGCRRKACFHHKLRLVSGDEALQRLFQKVGREDTYL